MGLNIACTGACAYTKRNWFRFLLILTGKLSYYNKSVLFWINRNSRWIKIDRKTSNSMIFRSIWQEAEIHNFRWIYALLHRSRFCPKSFRLLKYKPDLILIKMLRTHEMLLKVSGLRLIFWTFFGALKNWTKYHYTLQNFHLVLERSRILVGSKKE